MGCTESHLQRSPRDQHIDLRIPVGDVDRQETVNIDGVQLFMSSGGTTMSREQFREHAQSSASARTEIKRQAMLVSIFSGARQVGKNQRKITDKFGEELLVEHRPILDLAERFWGHRSYVLVAKPASKSVSQDKDLFEGKNTII